MPQVPEPTSSPTYVEQLRVPLRWWAIATMFHASTLLALLVAGLGLWSVVVMAVVVALTVAVLVAYGRARIVVSDTELLAGRARVPLRLVGSPQALDVDATRERVGPSADARAYLLVRPYVPGSVVVEILDPADPTPYWLLSTRRPGALAAALSAQVPAPAPGTGGDAVAPLRGVSPETDRAD